MTLQTATLIFAALVCVTLCVVSFCVLKIVQMQQKAILNIAMFKKASDPWHLSVMQAAMNAIVPEQEEVKPNPVDDEVLPSKFSAEAVSNLRSQI